MRQPMTDSKTLLATVSAILNQSFDYEVEDIETSPEDIRIGNVVMTGTEMGYVISYYEAGNYEAPATYVDAADALVEFSRRLNAIDSTATIPA